MASTSVPTLKVILCGEFGVGKSSIFRRFANNTFITATDRKSTLGLDFWSKEYGELGNRIKLSLFDTGGMERVASVTSSYYKFSEAAILVFSLDNADSFNSLSEYLLEVVAYAENAKIFLCGNKSDLKVQEVSDSDVEVFCEQCCTLISGYHKISCKTGTGIEELFTDVANTLIENCRSRLELNRLERNEERGFQVFDTSGASSTTSEENCAC